MNRQVPAGECARVRNPTFLCVLPLLLLFAAQGLCAQTAAPEAGIPISVDVGLVILHATVRNKKGEFVSGLQKDNFQVFEDGVPQTIQVFQHEDMPVAVGLIVDNSGSMQRKRKEVTAAALVFADSSNPQDEMFVVNFNEHVSFGLPYTKLFSASAGELTEALNGIPAHGKTALYDAIAVGLEHLKKATLSKKVLIVISDGGDNASHCTLNEVLDSAAHSDVIIYTIGLFDEYDEDRNPGVLKKIARATGGEAFFPPEIENVVPVCRRIAEEIRTQYTIGYRPSHPVLDNTYRIIRVTATGPHGRKLRVQTRTGYIASPERKRTVR
jgi:Ca-activated chloride channel family protein